MADQQLLSHIQQLINRRQMGELYLGKCICHSNNEREKVCLIRLFPQLGSTLKELYCNCRINSF